MNTLEDRLRDAYQAAARTVDPGTVLAGGVRGLRGFPGGEERGRPPGRRPGRPGRWLVPCAAAAAVVAVVAGTTVLTQAVTPKASRHSGHGLPASEPLRTPRYFVALNWTTHPSMFVVNAGTGARGQTIALPPAAGGLDGVATGDGRTFVAALSRPDQCRTALYRFTVSPGGHPSTLTKIASVRWLVGGLAVAGDGQTIAYYQASDAAICAPKAVRRHWSDWILRHPVRSDLQVLNLATGRSRNWTYSFNMTASEDNPYAGGVSLSEDGSTVALGDWILPANAPSGSLVDWARTAARPGEFGSSTIMDGLALAPDGKALYFGTFAVSEDPVHMDWQLRASNLVTGRISLVRSFPGDLPTGVDASPDPTGRYLLVEFAPASGQSPLLARIDLATGRMTRLNDSWTKLASIAW